MCNRDTCIEYQLVDPMLQEAMTLQEVSCGESKQELSIQKTINETIYINKIIIYNIIVMYFKACICPDVCVFDLAWVLGAVYRILVRYKMCFYFTIFSLGKLLYIQNRRVGCKKDNPHFRR